MKFRKRPIVVEAVRFRGEDLQAMELGLSQKFDGQWTIQTLEGTMRCNPGDWIVTGIKGERYPVAPGIFAATYEPVEQPS